MLSGELNQLFQVAAMFEGSNGPCLKQGFFDLDKGTEQVDINLPEMHSKIVSEIRTEYHREGDRLIELTRELFRVVAAEFERRWAKKRDSAKLVRSWELPK